MYRGTERCFPYRYGADGQRALKYSTSSETLYFNTMWQMRTDPSGTLRQSKNVYVGEARIATKSNFKGDDSVSYELGNVYWYHSDHLGSAQLVTDRDGREHERLEYTPYGELWIEKTQNGIDKLPFRFTGKEIDEETGLYYYGARYLDPKYSRWLSADPALGEYIPGAPVNEEARKQNGNLPGMGGVFNTVNMSLYHYAGNNPVKYTDPSGESATVTLAIVVGLSSGAASVVSDMMTTGKINWRDAGAATIGGVITGAMIGSVIDTCGASGVAIGTLVASGGMAGVVGGAATDAVKGNNPMNAKSVISNGLNGVTSILTGEVIGKVGSVATKAVNKSNATYMQNTNTQKASPLVVDFKETIGVMKGNERAVNAITETTKQAADMLKDVLNNNNDN